MYHVRERVNKQVAWWRDFRPETDGLDLNQGFALD